MSQTHIVRGVATTISQEEGYTVIRYHATPVVKFNNTLVILNTGGWYTATTKVRMNQAAQQFGLNYGVSQRKGQWYVALWDRTEKKWIDEVPFNSTGIHTIER